jgi:AcrR family transcriptional regulator
MADSGNDRRTEIVLEAAQVFRERGYGGSSMNLVAERLNITKPGLYYHFKSKQDLLFAILNHALDWLERDALAATMSAQDSMGRLQAIIYRHAHLITMENEGALTVLVVDEADSLTPEDHRMITQRKRTYFEIVRATIEQLKVEGKLREGVDPTLATFSLLGLSSILKVRPEPVAVGE